MEPVLSVSFFMLFCVCVYRGGRGRVGPKQPSGTTLTTPDHQQSTEFVGETYGKLIFVQSGRADMNSFHSEVTGGPPKICTNSQNCECELVWKKDLCRCK